MDRSRDLKSSIRNILGTRTTGLTIWIVIVFLEIYWLGVKTCEHKGSEPFEHNAVVRILRHRAIGQTFVPRANHLSGIRVFFWVPKQTSGIPLEFHLQQVGRDGKEVAHLTTTISKTGWANFRFPRIPDSLGFAHHFYVVVRGAREAPLFAAIATDDPYHEGAAYGQGTGGRGDLRFEILHAATIYDRLDDIVAGKPHIWGSKALLMVVFFSYNLALGLFFLLAYPFVASPEAASSKMATGAD